LRLHMLFVALIVWMSWTSASAAYPVGSPVAVNGQLSVCGAHLCNEGGSPIQLRGVSSHGLSWYGQYMNRSSIAWLASDWGVDVVRAAMYTEQGGYVDGGSWQRNLLEARLDTMVAATEAAGVYLIIDWHILTDKNPQTNQDSAISFFKRMVSKYHGKSHILWEICNEPNGTTTWTQISAYANAVIPAIQAINAQAVIIVGTPTWSQDVDVAAAAPLSYANVMYTLHFYAGTHKQALRDRVATAIAKGLPIFSTEWGTTDASGDGNVDTASSREWLDSLASWKISWCNWSISDKVESSAALVSGADTLGGWTETGLTASGRFVRNHTLNPADDFSSGSGPFLLKLQASGGSITASPLKDSYAKGDTVHLIARADANHTFASWSGGTIGTDTQTAVVMDGNRVVQANFRYTGTVTLSVVTSAHGNVAVSPIKSAYAQGDTVTVTAKADSGATFMGWTGMLSGATNPLKVVMASDTTIGAEFLPDSGGDNLLQNGSFDSGSAHWGMAWYSGASGTSGVVDDAYRTVISDSGSDVWHVQLTQSPVKLVQGRRYELAFTAWASAARSIYPNIGQSSGTYTSYSKWNNLQIDTSHARYHLYFTMTEATDTAARMEFDLGNYLATVTLDDIVLRQIPSATTAKTNKLPVLGDLSESLPQDSSLSLTLAGRDSDGVIAGYRVTTAPLHGTTTLVGSALRYVPDSSFVGSDSVFVEAEDDSGAWSSPALVKFTVLHVNHAPTVAAPLADLVIPEDTGTVSVNLTGVFADRDGDSLRLTVAHSNATLLTTELSDKALRFSVAPDSFGIDTVRVCAADDSGASVCDTFAVRVRSVNDAPTLPSDSATTFQETAVSVSLSGADKDGHITGYRVTTTPLHGAATLVGSVLRYLPDSNFVGIDNLFAEAEDDSGAWSSPALVKFTVLHVNHAPSIAAPLADLVIPEDTGTVSVNLTGVFADRDGDSLRLAVSHSNATLFTVNLSGKVLRISVAPDSFGLDTVRVCATDDSGASVCDTFAVRVRSVNDVPTLAGDSAKTLQETAVSVSLSGADKDGHITGYRVTTTPLHGAATLVGSVLRYLPDSNFVGSDSLFAEAEDDSGAWSSPALVKFTVLHVNHAPTVAAPLAGLVIPEDTGTVSVNLTGVFADRDGDSLRLTVAHSNVALLTANLSGKVLRISVASDSFGLDTVRVCATDDSGASACDTFAVRVRSVNDVPTLAGDSATTFQEMAVSVRLSGSDKDGLVTGYRVSTSPLHGTTTFVGSTLNYIPASGFVGSDSLFVEAEDDSGAWSLPAKLMFKVFAKPVTTSVEASLRPIVSTEVALAVARPMAQVRLDMGNDAFGTDVPECADSASCLSMTVQLPKAASVSVAIYDNLGTLVTDFSTEVSQERLRTLPETVDGRRTLPLLWNLRARGGRNVAAGVYLWKVRVLTVDGDSFETVRRLGVSSTR